MIENCNKYYGSLHFPVNTSWINVALENFLDLMIMRFKSDIQV